MHNFSMFAMNGTPGPPMSPPRYDDHVEDQHDTSFVTDVLTPMVGTKVE